MSTRVREALAGTFGGLRHEPIGKRIRAEAAGDVVVDSTRAAVVWEPRRVVPSYAVPPGRPADRAEHRPRRGARGGGRRPAAARRHVAADPGPVDPVRRPHRRRRGRRRRTPAGRTLAGAAFLVADEDLPGYVAPGLRRVRRLVRGGRAHGGAPAGPVPPRRRLPQLAAGPPRARRRGPRRVVPPGAAVRVDAAHAVLPAARGRPRRADAESDDLDCAYKGRATYWSPVVGGRTVPDLAWSYEEPLREAEPVRSLVCFFDEQVDVVLDGVRRERPVTPWSRDS